jgi:hypothetical protein
MTLHHVFQRVDRVLRNRPDALRWRVTMTAEAVEVFRRPILTSDITLGALGLTDAPMPVPVCIARITLIDAGTTMIESHHTYEQERAPVLQAAERVVVLVNRFIDPLDQ